MGVPMREETIALYELLSDGEWHNGVLVHQEIQRVIPPGAASRAARVKDPDAWSLEERVRLGKHHRSRESMKAAISTSRFVVDTPDGKLTKAHWSGEIPWQIRDTEAGYLSVEQMADKLDLGPHIVRNWVKNGFIPYSENHAGVVRFTPEQQDVVRKVAAIYPGPGKIRWPVDPKSLWDVKEAGVTVQCPNCDHKLTVTLAAQ